MLRGYTRPVAAWTNRLASFAAVFALSGSPAALSACMALCLQPAPMTALADEQGALVRQTAPASSAAGVSCHSAHSSPAAHAAPASADARALAHELSNVRLGATGDCCSHGVTVAAVTGPGVERANAHAFGAAAMAVPLARYLLTTSVLGATPHSPPASPPAPTSAPLVLRI